VIEEITTSVPTAAGTITFDGPGLSFPEGVDDDALERAIGSLSRTSLHDGVRESIERFTELLASGRVAAPTPS
jgi:hypothetical protein